MAPKKILLRDMDSEFPWGDDRLSTYLRQTEKNTFAVTINLEGLYRQAVHVNDVWWEAAEVVERTSGDSEKIRALFIRLSNSAWTAGVRVGLGGQPVDTTPLHRSALEYAGYAVLLKVEPALSEVWRARQQSKAAKDRCRAAFSMAKVTKAVKKADVKVGEMFSKLYEDLIDLGAHPNEQGVTARLSEEDKGAYTESEVIHITNDLALLAGALQVALMTGYTALRAFGVVFPEKFELTSLDLKVEGLRPAGRINVQRV